MENENYWSCTVVDIFEWQAGPFQRAVCHPNCCPAIYLHEYLHSSRLIYLTELFQQQHSNLQFVAAKVNKITYRLPPSHFFFFCCLIITGSKSQSLLSNCSHILNFILLCNLSILWKRNSNSKFSPAIQDGDSPPSSFRMDKNCWPCYQFLHSENHLRTSPNWPQMTKHTANLALPLVPTPQEQNNCICFSSIVVTGN